MSTNLEHAARRLLDDWSAGRNLSEAANMIREALPDAPAMKAEDVDAYREAARRLHAKDGEIEFDDSPAVSASNPPDGGAYVAAWVWVPAEEVTPAPVCGKCGTLETMSPGDTLCEACDEIENPRAPVCTCCRHWRGQVDCGGVDCVTCEGCSGGED